MALTYSGQLISGLSTDVKPTDVSYGMMFIETDTSSFYWFMPVGWVRPTSLSVALNAPGSMTLPAGSFLRVCDCLSLGASEGVTLGAGAQLRID